MIRIFIDIETASLDDGDETAPRLRLELTPGVAADGVGAFTEGVEVRLGQVFRNLLANARSFSPPGGRIDVSIARQDGLTPDDDVLLVVTVSDEGPGLPPGKEEAIFDRFYSERPASEAFGSHSGLGLSISRQIVSAHGGTIRAENRLGPGGDVIGARFVVMLPALNGAVSA